MDVLGTQSDTSDFRSALRRADLESLLNGPGPYTVFAPTNLAWAATSEQFRNGGAASLRNFIAGGRLRLPDIQARGNRVRMLSGIDAVLVGGTAAAPRIQAARAGAAPSGASASILRPNLLCSNGVVHILGGALIPA
nr:fasciclin domain-containing protein [Neoroseomonas eburnea]